MSSSILGKNLSMRVKIRMAFGVWRLAFGVWRLAFGVWRLACGEEVGNLAAAEEAVLEDFHRANDGEPGYAGRGVIEVSTLGGTRVGL